jgi:hypothetical protein
MAKFKVMLEQIETIIKQGAVMVEAGSAEEARRIILADLEVDQGSYYNVGRRGLPLYLPDRFPDFEAGSQSLGQTCLEQALPKSITISRPFEGFLAQKSRDRKIGGLTTRFLYLPCSNIDLAGQCVTCGQIATDPGWHRT